MALLSSDLVSPIEYTAGNELDFNLHFEAPANTEAKKFYLLGGLYTLEGNYIADTVFGILKVADVEYAVNDTIYASVWELEPEESVELPCKFILNQSDCLLILFLMRMVGDEASIIDDEEIAQIQVQLVAPVPIGEDIPGIITSIMPLIAMGLMFGMVAMMMPMMKKGLS